MSTWILLTVTHSIEDKVNGKCRVSVHKRRLETRRECNCGFLSMHLQVGGTKTLTDDMLVGFTFGFGIKITHQHYYVIWGHDIVDPVYGPRYLMHPDLIIRDRMMQVGVYDMHASAVKQL